MAKTVLSYSCLAITGNAFHHFSTHATHPLLKLKRSVLLLAKTSFAAILKVNAALFWLLDLHKSFDLHEIFTSPLRVGLNGHVMLYGISTTISLCLLLPVSLINL